MRTPGRRKLADLARKGKQTAIIAQKSEAENLRSLFFRAYPLGHQCGFHEDNDMFAVREISNKLLGSVDCGISFPIPLNSRST